jgi:hypothetical protein
MVEWVMTLFANFNADHPNSPRLKSHQLRKRVFTASWNAKIDRRKAAIAIGCNVDPRMKHSVASMNRRQSTNCSSGCPYITSPEGPHFRVVSDGERTVRSNPPLRTRGVVRE